MSEVTNAYDPNIERVPFAADRAIVTIAEIIEITLGFRFLLKALGANRSVWFTDAIYGLSAPLVAPFQGVFGSTVMRGSVIEWSTLLAIMFYGLASYVLARLFSLIARAKYY